MRHAKAEPLGRSDHGRVLTARGVRDAADAGSWLAGRGERVDHALVSSAARTQGTWRAVRDALGSPVDAEIVHPLYGADVAGVLEMLRLLPDEFGTVLVIGHNPTMAALVAELAGEGTGVDEAVASRSGFPTSSVSVLAFGGPWESLGDDAVELLAEHVGRG